MAYYTAIEIFGLPGVSSAADLTDPQLAFIHAAYWHRVELETPDADKKKHR